VDLLHLVAFFSQQNAGFQIQLLIQRKEKISKTKDNPDEIALIKFKLFHFNSILVLSDFNSSIENVSKLVLSNISFKGIFPNIVTPKTPTQ